MPLHRNPVGAQGDATSPGRVAHDHLFGSLSLSGKGITRFDYRRQHVLISNTTSRLYPGVTFAGIVLPT
jgi:hypothetical protein